MANLHQYYKEEKWNAFFQNIVPTELEKNIKFIEYPQYHIIFVYLLKIK